jgi:hypothetical protein
MYEVIIFITAFWNMMTCTLVDRYWCFGWNYCLSLLPWIWRQFSIPKYRKDSPNYMPLHPNPKASPMKCQTASLEPYHEIPAHGSPNCDIQTYKCLRGFKEGLVVNYITSLSKRQPVRTAHPDQHSVMDCLCHLDPLWSIAWVYMILVDAPLLHVLIWQ